MYSTPYSWRVMAYSSMRCTLFFPLPVSRGPPFEGRWYRTHLIRIQCTVRTYCIVEDFFGQSQIKFGPPIFFSPPLYSSSPISIVILTKQVQWLMVDQWRTSIFSSPCSTFGPFKSLLSNINVSLHVQTLFRITSLSSRSAPQLDRLSMELHSLTWACK